MRLAPWFLLLLLVTGIARADEPGESRESESPFVPAPEPEPEPSGPFAPFTWWWQHSAAVPILFFSPENQLGLGLGQITTWTLPRSIRERPSNVTAYGIYTTRKQTIAGLSYELRFAEDRHIWYQEFRYIDWADRFYGIGNFTRTQDRDNFTDHYQQLESEYQYRAISHLYVGARHLLRASRTLDVREGLLTRDRPFGLGQLGWSGFGGVLLWDSRQGIFWPLGGSYLRFDATFHRKFFGADFDATLMRLDLRHYQPLWFHHILALRFITMGATGQVPFQMLPGLGGPNLFRGWFLGRLRDRTLMALDAEYRVPIGKWFSAVAFGSVGRVAPRLGAMNPANLRGAGGGGIRFAVRPENRANLRLDMAYGSDFYVYFDFKEAF